MKKTTLLLLCSFAFIFSFGQNAVIKGVVNDTLNKQNLTNAVVSLLHTKDSVLYRFGRSNEKGNFEITNLQAGKYVMLVSYPTYADYYDTLTLQTNTVFDIGKVMLTPKLHLLEDVVVRQKIAAIRMRGDTIIYKADSFKLKEGASVEDLLKKFPGIQVDKTGKITAQGTKVEKVLVDGEEFFSDDPTVATRSLDAKMVNEVQVFDKKSDQSTFTGIDDGQSKRTINLKLKDDAKKGLFGKLELAAGPDDRWNNSLMANLFKGKRKLSFYGITSSTGKTGLNWDERGKYGSDAGMTSVMSDDGGMYITSNGDDFGGGNYWGEGIPKSWSAGINYSDKFKQDKQSINGSYRYSKLNNEGEGSTISQSILPDTLFFNNERRKTFGTKDKHGISGSYDWMFDSSFSAKLTVNASKGTTSGNSSYYSEALNAFNKPVNRSQRNTNSIGDNQQLNTSLLLRKKYKKIGRSLSVTIDQSYSENNSDGFLYAVNDYFDKTSILFRSDTTNQKKVNSSSGRTLSARAAYTEQLAKNTTMELSYSINQNNNENKVLSFDKTKAGSYDSLNKTFSNDFDFNILTNKAGIAFRYNTKKYNFSAAGEISNADFKQRDVIKDSLATYNFVNFFPRANFTYKFNSNRRINIGYNGNTRQPTINQIQPVADNTNPLNIQVGNPNLKQEFSHRINLNYNDYKILKNRGIWMSMNFSTINNAIRTSQFTDSLGRTKTQFVNLNGNYNFGGYFDYSMKLEKLGLDMNIGLEYNNSNNVTFVNGLKNINKNNSQGINLRLSKDEEKKYDISLRMGIDYNASNSSIRPDVKTNYWTMEHNIDATVFLPWKIEVGSDIEFQLREKTELFTGNNNVTRWNAYLSKKVLKGDKGQIRFTAFDMLDQNKGFSRYIGSTTVTENTFNQLSRYFLLSLIWNFNKGGVKK
jgi:Outer membrane protein beta-barrel family/CarboxypepD_reg-like domain